MSAPDNSDGGLPPRLVTERTDEGRAVRRYLRHPHSASEPRVWQRVASARRAAAARRSWAPVAWAAAGAVVGVATLGLLSRGDGLFRQAVQAPATVAKGAEVAKGPAPISRQSITLGPAATTLAAGRWAIPDEVALDLDAGFAGSVEDVGAGVPRVTLLQGRARLAVTHKARPAPFELVSPPYRFTVLGTTFAVERGTNEVSLSVEEGRVAVSRGDRQLEIVATGGRWSGPVVVATAAPAAKSHRKVVAHAHARAPAPAAAPVPAVAPCGNGLSAREPERLQCLERQAAGTGLEAEIALYEIGKLKRGALGDPAGALAAFQALRTRFPDGGLRAEADLSAVELLARLGRHRAALDASASLLGEGRVGERAAELHLLRGNLYRESLGDLSRAAVEYQQAAGDGSHKATGDQASFLLAVTLEALGRHAEAADTYRRYLRRPRPAHEADARARLQRLEQTAR